MFQGSGLVWLGHYEEGIPTGICWQSVLGSAWLVGHLDSHLMWLFSIQIYPVLWLDSLLIGELVSAFHSKLISVREKSGLLIPSFEKVSVAESRSVNNNTLRTN